MSSDSSKLSLLLLNKQSGLTSFDCIRQLKKIFNRKDLGHGGTLDSFAEGLLPVFFGEGLKLSRFFLESYPALPTYWKTYSGTIHLGSETDTGDPSGAVTCSSPVPGNLTVAGIQKAMDVFLGESAQIPPNYSAVKIQGKRASDRIRSGETVELKPRNIFIRNFHCLEYENDRIHFRVECSKGTYVRVLAQDLAKALNTHATLEKLVREKVGSFDVSRATTLEPLNTFEIRAKENGSWLTLSEATSFIERFTLSAVEELELKQGRTLNAAVRLMNSGKNAGVYVAQNEAGKPLGMFELTESKLANYLRGFTE